MRAPATVRRSVLVALAATTASCAPVAFLSDAGANGPWSEPQQQAQTAAKRISLLDNRFSPSSSSTSADSVRFVWRGRNSHDVIFTQAPGSNPSTCGLQSRGSCSRPLRRRGTYRFVCSIHPEMTGKIRRR